MIDDVFGHQSDEERAGSALHGENGDPTRDFSAAADEPVGEENAPLQLEVVSDRIGEKSRQLIVACESIDCASRNQDDSQYTVLDIAVKPLVFDDEETESDL